MQLVTSWWVVCVWAAVSLATGLVSVVAVLQPAWYVRYSQIHAQDAQGVAFQVMVSSVGPLGYCRLSGVKQMTVAEEETYILTSTLTPTTTPAALWTSELPLSTGASEYPLETPREDTPSPLPPTTVTNSPPPSEGTLPTTPSPDAVQGPSPPADRDIGGNTSVASNGGSTLEAMVGTTTAPADISATVEANRSGEIPLTTLESFTSDGPSEADADKNYKTQEAQSTTEIPETPKQESNASGIVVATSSAGEGVRVGSSGRKRGGKLARPRTHAAASGAAPRKNATAVNRGRKRKGKHRRRKKMKNRKRPRAKEGGRSTSRSRGAPRPDLPLHHLLRASLEDRGDPVASPLQQPRLQEGLVSTDYRPRPPIFYCSGVGGGVGSGSSAVWALVGVLYGVAGVVQVAVGVASLAMHLPYLHAHPRRYIFAAWLGNAQVAVVMSQGVALVLFPLGLGSPLARGECGGSSSVYWPGECSFGWSYMLGVVATTLSAYCPCLARLTVFRKYDYKEWDSINFF